MNTLASGRRKAIIPKRRQRHYSYNESLNESAKLIADEPTDIEGETPAEESEPVESIEANDSMKPVAFEE